MPYRTELLKHIPKNSVGAEIGVHKGDFSKEILDIVKPKLLFLIDPWVIVEEKTYENSWYGKNVSQKEINGRFEYVSKRFQDFKNVRIIRKMSTDAALDIQENSLDFVYIDGDHTYSGVCSDFDNFFPKIKNGGLILGDDYHRGSWWGDGVIDALHKNLVEKKLKIKYLVETQFCLRKY